MSRLVDDLLDMSRISRGRIELRKQRIPLAPIINQAVEATRALYRSDESPADGFDVATLRRFISTRIGLAWLRSSGTS